ncbi:hypothetical protein GIB67_032089 [Kingdonia uniflora]|uniref:Sugar phosphate transporter domain-containing protein n=1 Tax=Kingdonia uniflora TaxID=39325 RepID=A0A7J7MX91_9MAGN|nr:hypothetical protein GIB67_032089 [Kingdonia uniflora]
MLCLDMRANLTAILFGLQVLKVFLLSITITTFQFAIGTTLVLFMWIFNLHKRPKITSLVAILPLAIMHTMGNLFTNMTLGKVVSFTHTIKAMEPFFSILLSAMFLGVMPTFWVVSCLVPIVGGVALTSISEASFNWIGFWSAMASNMTFQSRNVLSKKFMVNKKGLNAKNLCIKALVAGIFFHVYQMGYEILHFCLASNMTDEEINKGILFPSISSIRHITTKVGATVVRKGVVEKLAEGHGDIKTKKLMHISEEETNEYAAQSMWYPLYHPFVHEK